MADQAMIATDSGRIHMDRDANSDWRTLIHFGIWAAMLGALLCTTLFALSWIVPLDLCANVPGYWFCDATDIRAQRWTNLECALGFAGVIGFGFYLLRGFRQPVPA